MAIKMTLRIEQAPTKEWFAIDEDTYDGAPDAHHMMGWGNTPEEAAEDLVRLFTERSEYLESLAEDRAMAEAERLYEQGRKV